MRLRPDRRAVALLLIGMAACFVYQEGRSRAQPAPAVTLKSVTYAELSEAVRGSKGKVVLVDVWAEY